MSISGLDIGLRALAAQQQAIDVLNHNIANANTPGYSRQRIHLVATPPNLVPSLTQMLSRRQVGSGVTAESVDRIRDRFIDFQIQTENRTLGEAQIKKQVYDKLQLVFNEPSESGINSALGQFWGTWHDLSSNPGDRSARSAVLQQALSLTNLINRTYNQLTTTRNDLAAQAALKVADVNSIAARLANLNGQIQRAQLGGAKANDLLDRRDLLLEELSKIIKFNYAVKSDDTIAVFVDGQELVSMTSYRSLTSSLDTSFVLHVQWADNLAEVNPGGGELQGVVASANTVIASQITSLDNLALQIKNDVNALHATGFDLTGATGVNFFAGTGARDLTIEGAIQASVDKIAAAGQPSAPGDGTVALAIAQLQHLATELDALSELAAGGSLPISGASVQRILTSGASPTTYTITSSGANELTLSAVIGGVPVSQTITISDMAANSSQALEFSSLGITIDLRSGAVAATAADLITDLTDAARDELIVTTRVTVDSAYQQHVAQLGVEARGNDHTVLNELALVGSLQRQWDSISGVSLDEEAANLVKYQRAYQASARVITVLDELLEMVVRGLGVVGRI